MLNSIVNDKVRPADQKTWPRPPARRLAFLAVFPPEYFSMVMATGIVSIALDDDGWHVAARVLLWLNCAAFVTLWAISLVRFVVYRARFIEDLTHHSHSAAFLTTVAATCVLGSQFAMFDLWISVAKSLWLLGIFLWIALIYTFFTVVTVRNPKPSLQAGINGVWLLTVVSTESICVLGTLIVPSSMRSEWILFPSLAFCLAGGAFYMFFITLILYRWMFFRMKAEKLTPDYWIDMGALAIVTLALALLLTVSGRWELLTQLAPFLKGFMLLFWATATWWIPFLCIVEIWRHTYGKVPFTYSPDYWSLVFPLGMYSEATTTVAKTSSLAFLHPLASTFSYLAAICWFLVFVGLLWNLMRKARSGRN